ncbi:hypothetical protein I4U23_014084 [Adineta vaga]|nr:hypothetical protein I4U23_014084 [Adineta vaga]
MYRVSLIFLPMILAILTMTMANPCPCELIVNESLSNNGQNLNTDSANNQLVDIDTLDDYLDQLNEQTRPESLSDITSLYPLLQQTKNLDTNAPRLKRPSWAAVGKRAASLHNKRPSWAQVG